jgi:hypothetical protein
MVMTNPNLALDRCPHCFTANPTIHRHHVFHVQPGKGSHALAQSNRFLQWHAYTCTSCAGLVAAASEIDGGQTMFSPSLPAIKIVPEIATLSADIPPSLQGTYCKPVKRSARPVHRS